MPYQGFNCAERFLDDRKKALKAGLAKNWFPFGGGAPRCPERALQNI